jgi:hypothetical protein
MVYRFTWIAGVLGAALFTACGGDGFTSASSKGPSRSGPDAAIDGAAGRAGTGTGGSGAAMGAGGRGGTGGSAGGSKNTGGTGIGATSGSGGAGLKDGGGGTAGSDAGHGSGGRSSGGTPQSGGDAGTGNADSGSGGAGGNGGGGGGGCPDAKAWYVDADKDGYGSVAVPPVTACEQPSGRYTRTGGDCDDSEPDVHPQLTPSEKHFFDLPYKTPGGAISYDYDCSGKEVGDPALPLAGTCTLLTLNGVCGGTGYQPGNRTGKGANPYCGSQLYQTCKGSLSCTGTVSNATPYTCN